MPIEIQFPRLGWSMDEGTFVAWLKQDGDFVKAGEPLFTLESDKAAQDVEATDSGILRLAPDAPKEGAVVQVGRILGWFLAESETASTGAVESSPKPSSPISENPQANTESQKLCGITKPAANQPQSAGLPEPAGSHPASPRARRAAKEHHIDLSTLCPTGQGGRIRERDVLAAAPSSGNGNAEPSPHDREIPVTPLRRTIAERMVHSLRNTAPVTLTCRVDATNLVSMRNQFKAAGGDAIVPSFTDIIAKLTAVALQRHPLLAARWEGDRIRLAGALHIGIAVDTEHGLLVPVIRNVPDLALPALARHSRDLIAATRARRLKSEDLQGGVFTITSLGSFGIEAFTPIINFPETAILGLGVIRREPVVLNDGSLTSREQLTLSLTFDHRVVDGAPAARFLQTLRTGIENPAAWLLNQQPAAISQP